jgi:hypothetical protein
MSTTPARPLPPEEQASEAASGQGFRTRGVVAWSGFFFAVLQSICTFFFAVSGLRLLIGAGALALSASVGRVAGALHADWIRLPMILLALAGSLLNLVILWQLRRLRARPAAQWRIRPLSARKLRMEWLQLALSIATLVLVGVEEYIHVLWHHHL